MRKFFKFLNSKPVQSVWLVTMLLFPIILWILPGDFFDGDGLIICPSRLFFGIECLGCGLTRSVMHMHHFEFDDAIYYNLMGLVAYPVLIIIWCIWVFKAYKRVKADRVVLASQ